MICFFFLACDAVKLNNLRNNKRKNIILETIFKTNYLGIVIKFKLLIKKEAVISTFQPYRLRLKNK